MGIFNLFKKKKKEVVWDKTMQVLFCFRRNTFTIGDVLDLMDRSKYFKANAVSRERDFVVLTTEKYNELKNLDKEAHDKLLADGLIFFDEHNDKRVFIECFPNVKFQVIYWGFDKMQFLESPFFKELIAHPNLIVAYCFNAQDYARQNTFERKIEDIENNPGRFLITDDALLVSVWKSWFGKDFYALVSKERIRQFDKAFSIGELENGVTCVQLYANHEDFDRAENREIQSSFREWMGYKKLKEASQ